MFPLMMLKTFYKIIYKECFEVCDFSLFTPEKGLKVDSFIDIAVLD